MPVRRITQVIAEAEIFDLYPTRRITQVFAEIELPPAVGRTVSQLISQIEYSSLRRLVGQLVSQIEYLDRRIKVSQLVAQIEYRIVPEDLWGADQII